MTRIAVMSPFEPPSDGIAKHTKNLVEAWDAAGHSVMVLSPKVPSSLVANNRVGLRSEVLRTLGVAPRRRVLLDILTFDPEIVVVQFAIAALSVNLWTVLRLCQWCSAKKIPVVVTYHESAREYNLLGILTRSIYRAFARVTDAAIVFSAAGREALISAGLFGNVVEVGHGTVGSTHVSVDDVRRVRELYAIKSPLVLTLGFIGFDKGTDILLGAAQQISRPESNVQFLIAGVPRQRRGIFRIMRRRDDKYRRQLELQARTIADAHIAFGGFVADGDVAALLSMADVVALPYRTITQSGIANLALSSGSVIVCSDLPGLHSDLGDAAKYVEVGDVTALAIQIEAFLGDDNVASRQTMRELSEQRANENTYASVAQKILEAGLAVREK